MHHTHSVNQFKLLDRIPEFETFKIFRREMNWRIWTRVYKRKNLSNPEIGLWTKEDTIEKYAYMNILGNPRIIRLRKANKEFNEDFSYYYSLLEEIADNMIEFRIYWDMMLKLLRKYDII